MPIGIAGAVSLGSAAIGAGASLYGGSQAAGASKASADQQMKLAIADVNRLQPYTNAGYDALHDYSALARSGPNGGGPDYLSQAARLGSGPDQQRALENTPGYQWQLSQGLQAAQSSAAARGLGVSGAALKGAAKFATGLADSNYQNQFQNLLSLNAGQQGNLQNQFNRLSNVTSLGENAAAGAGNQANAAGAVSSGLTAQAGQQSAAGTLGVGNAISGAGQNYLGYNALQQMIAKNGAGGGGSLGGYPSTGSILQAPATINNAPWTSSF